MNAPEEPKPSIRPYFLPADVDFDSLPAGVKIAFEAIVAPAYHELVLSARNALERGMGASFVFLLTEEVLNHFEIGRQFNLTQMQSPAERDLREKAIARHLKLLGAKTSALHALLRLKQLPSFPRSIPREPPAV